MAGFDSLHYGVLTYGHESGWGISQADQSSAKNMAREGAFAGLTVATLGAGGAVGQGVKGIGAKILTGLGSGAAKSGAAQLVMGTAVISVGSGLSAGAVTVGANAIHNFGADDKDKVSLGENAVRNGILAAVAVPALYATARGTAKASQALVKAAGLGGAETAAVQGAEKAAESTLRQIMMASAKSTAGNLALANIGSYAINDGEILTWQQDVSMAAVGFGATALANRLGGSFVKPKGAAIAEGETAAANLAARKVGAAEGVSVRRKHRQRCGEGSCADRKCGRQIPRRSIGKRGERGSESGH
jgi:hypothetical protein